MFLNQLLRWLRRFSVLERNRGDESIAASRNVDQVPMPFATVSQHPSQCCDMDCQIGGFDVHVRPYPCHELLFADQLARALDQCEEDVECPTADVEKLFDLQKL